MRKLKRAGRALVAPLLFLSLTGYFSWQVTQGDRGLRAYAVRTEQARIARAELARIEAERDLWERKVASLRLTRLDPDVLEERARAMLNVVDPADIVVPYAQGKRLF